MSFSSPESARSSESSEVSVFAIWAELELNFGTAQLIKPLWTCQQSQIHIPASNQDGELVVSDGDEERC